MSDLQLLPAGGLFRAVHTTAPSQIQALKILKLEYLPSSGLQTFTVAQSGASWSK